MRAWIDAYTILRVAFLDRPEVRISTEDVETRKAWRVRVSGRYPQPLADQGWVEVSGYMIVPHDYQLPPVIDSAREIRLAYSRRALAVGVLVPPPPVRVRVGGRSVLLRKTDVGPSQVPGRLACLTSWPADALPSRRNVDRMRED